MHVYATCVGKKVQRTPGDRWMVVGPAEYIPRAEIGKTEKRYTCTTGVVDYGISKAVLHLVPRVLDLLIYMHAVSEH